MKIPSNLLAPLVAAFFFAVILVGNAWELPTMQQEFSESGGQVRTVNLIVEGLRCRGTSNFFMKKVSGTPGIVSVTTYVQEHRAQIEYDPAQIDTAGITEIVEKPVALRDGRIIRPFTVLESKE